MPNFCLLLTLRASKFCIFTSNTEIALDFYNSTSKGVDLGSNCVLEREGLAYNAYYIGHRYLSVVLVGYTIFEYATPYRRDRARQVSWTGHTFLYISIFS